MKLGLAVLALLFALVAPAVAKVPTDADIDAVAKELRCVVCQNLSVADSPSEMARQMRDLVREQLAAGRAPDEVKKYFVARYGEWVLLAPPTEGFGLVAWTMPLGALAVGVVVAVIVLRRWSRRTRAEVETGEDDVDDEAMQAVRAEIERRSR